MDTFVRALDIRELDELVATVGARSLATGLHYVRGLDVSKDEITAYRDHGTAAAVKLVRQRLTLSTDAARTLVDLRCGPYRSSRP